MHDFDPFLQVIQHHHGIHVQPGLFLAPLLFHLLEATQIPQNLVKSGGDADGLIGGCSRRIEGNHHPVQPAFDNLKALRFRQAGGIGQDADFRDSLFLSTPDGVTQPFAYQRLRRAGKP